ncbi:protein of unknown function [Hyphomicrobium sp. 1Nfss2.1]
MTTNQTTDDGAATWGLRTNVLIEGIAGRDVFIGRAPSNPRTLSVKWSPDVAVKAGRWVAIASRTLARSIRD